MSGYMSMPWTCQHCGYGHTGACPRVKAIDYYECGAVKRVEYHEPSPIIGGTVSVPSVFGTYKPTSVAVDPPDLQKSNT